MPADGSTVEVGLGLFVADGRSRRADVPAARAERLTALGVRWAQRAVPGAARPLQHEPGRGQGGRRPS